MVHAKGCEEKACPGTAPWHVVCVCEGMVWRHIVPLRAKVSFIVICTFCTSVLFISYSFCISCMEWRSVPVPWKPQKQVTVSKSPGIHNISGYLQSHLEQGLAAGGCCFCVSLLWLTLGLVYMAAVLWVKWRAQKRRCLQFLGAVEQAGGRQADRMLWQGWWRGQ